MENQRRRELLIKLIICAVALMVIAASIIIYFTVIKGDPEDGKKSITLIIECGGDTYTYEDIKTDKNYVFEFLVEQNEALELGFEHSESELYGAFIVSLKNVQQNPEAGLYYVYTLNDEYADGISTQAISDGDKIVITLSQF